MVKDRKVGFIINLVLLSSSLILTLSLASPASAGNKPDSVPGTSDNPRCLTSSNANAVAKSAVTNSSMKLCQKGDGLSQETAGSSAWQIKRDFQSSVDGIYWIKNSAINSGAPFKIYADMTTEGGGWTLIVANSIHNWSYSETLLHNQNNPPTNPTDLSMQNGKYSILNYADYIKKSASGFQYRIDARIFQSCGGIWTANSSYSFVSTSNLNTNISEVKKWGYEGQTWQYSTEGIEQRMPYVSQFGAGLLTTSISPNEEWWGTLIQSGFWENGSTTYVTPWINYLAWGNNVAGVEPCSRPSIIWYWVR